MNLIEWINGITKLNKTTMDKFQNNINDEFSGINSRIDEFSGMPVGSGCDYFGTVAPDGFMFADGSAISRTEYAKLFELIGETYGSGDGETTFNLPDKRTRVSVMYSGSDDTFNAIGKTGGEKKHTLTVAEMPGHSHGGVVTNVTTDQRGRVDGSGVTYAKAGTSGNTASAGGNQAHNILQPYLVCNYIIKVN